MSVYTSVNLQQLQRFFSHYALGEVLSFAGIAEGISNSNYQVTTTQGAWVLTVFESLTVEELTPLMALLSHLGSINPLYPKLQLNLNGQFLSELKYKPAVVCHRLPGEAISEPSIAQCGQIGKQLARLHLATLRYVVPLKNRHDLPGLKNRYRAIEALLSSNDRELLLDELHFQSQQASCKLPTGIIHGDLFRDNVLFVEGHISGIVDFYDACRDQLLRDLAITANDWCCESGMMNPDKTAALLSGYQAIRPLELLEKQQWSAMLRLAALRFWMSRLVHQQHPLEGALTQQKNPLVFRNLLVQHRHSDSNLRGL